MDTTVTEMAVQRGLVAEAVHQLTKVAEVGAHVFGGYGSVLPTGKGIAQGRRTRCSAQRRITGIPDLFLLRLANEQRHGRGRIGGTQIPHQCMGLVGGLLLGIATELDQQPAVAIGQHRARLGMHVLVAHFADQQMIHPLEPHRAEGQDIGDMVAGGVYVRVAEHDHATRLRTGHQLQLRFQNDDTGSLGADQRPRHVEALVLEQLVEVVT